MKVWKEEMIVSFSYHLHSMLSSGITLRDSLHMLTTQQIIPAVEGQKVMETIQKGESFSTALRAVSLPTIFCSFIEAAEHHGNILFALNQCHRYYQARVKWKRKIKQITFYPLFILAFLCMGLLFLSTIVLPTFSELYRSFSSTLPFTTQVVFTLSAYFPYLLVAGLLLLFISLRFRRKMFFQYVISKIPFVSTYYRYRYTQYLSLQLSSFIVAGVPMLSSFSLLEHVTPWPKLANYLSFTKQKLMEGSTLGTIISENCDCLLPAFSQTVVLGEETGKLGEMLGQLASTSEEWLTERIEKWMTYLEPILTLMIGIIMGIVVVSLFLPMFGLIEAVQ
jgi:type II secretory pathway component PulF